MFSPQTYSERRKELKKLVGSGVIYLPGNIDVPVNYAANVYQFRQDSAFLYYFGLDDKNVHGVIDVDEDTEMIFGDDRSLDDVVWMGDEPSMAEKAAKAGISKTEPVANLKDFLKSRTTKGRRLHYLPQYRTENKLLFEDLLGIKYDAVNDYQSQELIEAVVKQRSVKTEEELEQIELALEASYEMNTTAMKLSKPGLYERDVVAVLKGIAGKWGRSTSFGIIFSVHGEILHNETYNNEMKDGDLLVLDSGSESPRYYASDITRTFPVNGKYTDKQKAIYETVLRSQMEAIDMIKPDLKFREVHLHSAKVIAEGLKDIGLMKGNIDDAVEQGAHALFFPHGLGHHMGLDVHDMEGLGEDNVGYDEETKRSSQFGTAFLRMGKRMKPGYVLTVEPGCYFIPKLYQDWKAENKHAEFINYDKYEEYLDFGGVRIEDDVVVTDSGYRVLGKKPIPKTVEDVEAACNS